MAKPAVDQAYDLYEKLFNLAHVVVDEDATEALTLALLLDGAVCDDMTEDEAREKLRVLMEKYDIK